MRGLLLFAVVLGLTGPCMAWAQTVSVRAEEHEGFSRLVLSAADARDWSFGRTEDGYELRMTGGAAFDLSGAGQGASARITAVLADPETGALHLRIGCACHALPFEFQAGVLMIDVRDGPAPAGSSFELSRNGAQVPALGAPGPDRPRPRPAGLAVAGKADTAAEEPGYDWTRDARLMPGGGHPLTFPSGITTGKGSAALRDGLLRQLGEGAARGVVTLKIPPDGKGLPEGTKAALAGGASQIRVGEDLGLVTTTGGHDDAAPMTAEGAVCPEDARLDLASWGAEGAVSSALSPMLQGMVGEFDRPDPVAVERAARYLLHLGFGAEARRLLAAFDTPVADREMLLAMAWLVDGEDDPAGIFAPMAACDSAAALWAALSARHRGDRPVIETDAVLRAFGALPPHLRQHLGPDLAAWFLEAGGSETARALSEAMSRAPGGEGPGARLTGARVDLAMGDTHKATEGLETLAAENSAVTPEALMDLVRARVAAGEAVDQAGIDALMAFVQEYRGSATEPALREALVIAQATAGQFGPAFAGAAELPAEVPDLWRLLAEKGPDDAVLTHAVLSAGAILPDIRPELRRRFAERLTDLGLPDAGLRWLPEGAASPEDRLSAAVTQIARRDGLSALANLEGLPDAEAGSLRAGAHLLLNQPGDALLQYAALGDSEGAARAARRARDWERLLADQNPVWSGAARLVAPDAAEAAPGREAPGPLARSAALLEESRTARQAIAGLLAGVPAPAAPTPAAPAPGG